MEGNGPVPMDVDSPSGSTTQKSKKISFAFGTSTVGQNRAHKRISLMEGKTKIPVPTGRTPPERKSSDSMRSVRSRTPSKDTELPRDSKNSIVKTNNDELSQSAMEVAFLAEHEHATEQSAMEVVPVEQETSVTEEDQVTLKSAMEVPHVARPDIPVKGNATQRSAMEVPHVEPESSAFEGSHFAPTAVAPTQTAIVFAQTAIVPAQTAVVPAPPRRRHLPPEVQQYLDALPPRLYVYSKFEGNFTDLESIGAGTFGYVFYWPLYFVIQFFTICLHRTVYKAHMTATGQIVALKKLVDKKCQNNIVSVVYRPHRIPPLVTYSLFVLVYTTQYTGDEVLNKVPPQEHSHLLWCGRVRRR